MAKSDKHLVILYRSDREKPWTKIGRATRFTGDQGEGIACTIEAIPINWNGEFFLFSKEIRERKE